MHRCFREASGLSGDMPSGFIASREFGIISWRLTSLPPRLIPRELHLVESDNVLIGDLALFNRLADLS